MLKVIKISILGGLFLFITGCTGSIYNKNKDCSYDYVLHPAISISKIVGGCEL